VVLGFCTAVSGNARFVFAERVDGELQFRRGFEVAPRERVLIVEDVVTTGKSVREIVDLVNQTPGSLVGVGALIDRGDPARMTDLGVPVRSLVRLETESWGESECPLCSEGVPLEDPGSRRLR
jgi:orotate phosphoribosyltransferase